jgi:hypothetical protein
MRFAAYFVYAVKSGIRVVFTQIVLGQILQVTTSATVLIMQSYLKEGHKHDLHTIG